MSGAAERNEGIIFVCYDNEAYMNNGIQRPSATPASCWTITAPASALKPQEEKGMAATKAAHGVPYTATASIANPDELIAKLGKAKTIRGAKFIHHYASCPTGWRHSPELSVEVARLAVQNRVFPLHEVEHGQGWRLGPMPPKDSVDAYLKFKAGSRPWGQRPKPSSNETVERD